MEKHILAGMISEVELRAFLGNAIAIAIGFLLKVVQDWRNNRISLKSIVVQFVSSLGVCYFVWKGSFQVAWIAHRIEFILGIASLCSVQIVTSLETLAREGLKGFIRKKINELGGNNNDIPDSPAA